MVGTPDMLVGKPVPLQRCLLAQLEARATEVVTLEEGMRSRRASRDSATDSAVGGTPDVLLMATTLTSCMELDDLAVLIFSHLSLESVAAAALACTTCARVCQRDALWKALALNLWPLLPPRLRPTEPSAWRELCRARAAPRWRRAANHMDSLEILAQKGFVPDDGDRFATLALGVCCSFGTTAGHALAQVEGRSWVRVIRDELVLRPAALGALQSWAVARNDSLDEY